MWTKLCRKSIKTFKTTANTIFCEKYSYEIDQDKQKQFEKTIFIKDDISGILQNLKLKFYQ